jgi:hypothetical protein
MADASNGASFKQKPAHLTRASSAATDATAADSMAGGNDANARTARTEIVHITSRNAFMNKFTKMTAGTWIVGATPGLGRVAQISAVAAAESSDFRTVKSATPI